jgi:hypothetical protein
MFVKSHAKAWPELQDWSFDFGKTNLYIFPLAH